MARSVKAPPPAASGPDEVADLDPGLADPAVDRGVHPAVAQVQLGVADGGLGGLDLGLGRRRSRRRSRPSPARGWRGRPRPATPTACGRPRPCRGPRPSRRCGPASARLRRSWIWASSSCARSSSSCAAATSRPLDSSAFSSAASASAWRAWADCEGDLVRLLVDHEQELPLLDRRPLVEVALGEEPADAGPDRRRPPGRGSSRWASPRSARSSAATRPRRPSGAAGRPWRPASGSRPWRSAATTAARHAAEPLRRADAKVANRSHGSGTPDDLDSDRA